MTKLYSFVRIILHTCERGVFMIQNYYHACKEDPSLIFSLIKNGEFVEVEQLLLDNIVNINTEDSIGNTVMMRLLKAKQYDMVLQFMKKKNWDVNHQNEDGNTFGHLLAGHDCVQAVQIVEYLKSKSNYLPNIRNYRGETAMDIALSNHYLCTAFKILEDKRFDEIDLFSFKHLFNATVRSKLYGKYSKIMNLEIIVESLEKKDLEEDLKNLIRYIKENMEAIKNSILNGRLGILDAIMNA